MDGVISGTTIAALAAKLDEMSGEFTAEEQAALDAIFELAGAALNELSKDVDGFASLSPVGSSSNAPVARPAFAASWFGTARESDGLSQAARGSRVASLDHGFSAGLMRNWFL